MNDRPVEVVVTGAHKKPIPLGSEIYEQVLDDLRHAGGSSQSSPSTSASLSSPASSTSSSSSSSSRPCFNGYRITAKAELLPGYGDAVGNIGHTLDPSFRSDACQGHGQGRDLSEQSFAQRGLRRCTHCGECLKSSAAGGRDPRPGADLSELWPPVAYEAGRERGRGQHPRGGQGDQSGGEAGRSVSATRDYDDVCCCGGPDRFREVVEEEEEEEAVDGVVVEDLWQRSSHHSSDTMGHGSISIPHRDRRHCGAADTGGGDHTAHLPQLSHHHHHHPHPSHSSGKNPTSPGPAAARTVVSLPAAEPRQHGKKKGLTAKASHAAADAKLSGHVNGSPNLPSSAPAVVRAAPGHVVSWTFSSWCAEGQAKDFTNLEEQEEEGKGKEKGEVEEGPGFLSSRSYPFPSRLYPPGSSGEQRETSPNSRRRGGSGQWNGGWEDSGEHLCVYAPSDSISQDASFSSATGRTPAAAAARGGSGNGSGCSNRSATRSPSLPPLSGHAAESPSLRGILERPCGFRTSTSTSPRPAAAAQQHQQHQHPHPHLQPHPSRGRFPNSTNQHVRLCSFLAEDVGDSGGGGRRDVASGDADDFSSLSGTAFRPRSVSDISVHAARRRQLPRRPALQKQSRLMQEQEDHAHVHWADEERGSSLSTSVLLTSIRPRALSHGSADLPRKPILKKPI